ncbi:MAG: transporter [Clostridium sp.]
MVLKLAAVFIGTLVGAGLASGQEITQFFTTYGVKGFIGIAICCLLYIPVCSMIVVISNKYNLKSYTGLIQIVSPGLLGKLTSIFMSIFLVCSSAIILAGSGALLHQYFGIPKFIGITIMTCVALFTLLKGSSGLITINSFIVPSLITVITTIFILYLVFCKNIVTIENITNLPIAKTQIIPAQWFISALLYGGFNVLCCSGVLVPLSTEIRNNKVLISGITLGAIGLTALCLMINLMLALNIPFIFKYDIPLLYVAQRFTEVVQIALLLIIWCEMFSTEVSDIYSLGKTIEQKFKIPYKKAIFLVYCFSIPISQIGFKELITILYPCFGVISLIFVAQIIIFYRRKCR